MEWLMKNVFLLAPVGLAGSVLGEAIFGRANLNEALLSAAIFILAGVSQTTFSEVERLQKRVDDDY
jgi:hypothetical protein